MNSVPLPTELNVTVSTITATSISLFWSVPTDPVLTSSEVMWQVSNNGGLTIVAETSGRITDTSYTIEGLESTTVYIITVTVTNKAGNITSTPVKITTNEGLMYYKTYT